MTAAPPTTLRRNPRDREMITPEGIALPITLASRGGRAGALMLDFMIIGFLQFATTVALLFMAGGTITGLMDGEQASGPAMSALEFLAVVWIIAMFLFRNAYFLFFELGPRGATPGKRLTGMRVASRDGGRLTVEMVIARNLLRDVELFLPLVFVSMAGAGEGGAAGIAAVAWFLIFAFFPFFNKDRLRAGDIIAGSWVVETPRRKLEAVLSGTPGSSAAAAAAPAPAHRFDFGERELSVYGEYELQTLERVLRDNRPEAMRAVYETICGKIGWTPGAGDERAFLDAFYTQLRARLESGMRMGRRKADKYTPGP